MSSLGNVVAWWSAECPEAADPGSCWEEDGV